MESIRVLVADDHEPFRRGLRTMVRGESDIDVVGEAHDGPSTVTRAESLQPDVILMDLSMPGLDGLAATRRILLTSPHIRILVLTMADNAESVFAALQAGARGYLVKGALKGDVLRAIRSVAAGDAIFGPAVAGQLLQYFSTARPHVGMDAFPELTEREREVLGLLVGNRSVQDIADILVLSPKTIRNHISNICTKLQVADRAEAILRAREAGVGR